MENNRKIGGFHGDVIQEAEEAVLGSCLIDPDAFLEARTVIGEDSKVFFFGKNRVLWDAFNGIWESGQPLDFTSVNWWIGDHGLVEDVTPAEVTSLINRTPTSMYVAHYAKRVKEAKRGRELERIVAGAMERLYAVTEEVDLDSIQTWVTDEIFKNVRPTEKPEHISETSKGVAARLKAVKQARKDGAQIGVPFGLKMVDKVIGGLRAGDLCILAARPAMGKTTAALQLAIDTVLEGGKVVFYSLEMSEEQLILKLVSYLTGIAYDQLRQGAWPDEEDVFIEAAEETLAGLDITIRDDLFTVNEVRDHALAWSAKGVHPDLVIIDYIQLSGVMDGERLSDNARVGFISRTLKLVARALDCPVLALSQLSRNVENRSDKRPVLSDLRDSGSLEQDADQVIFLYRDGYYDEACETPNVLDWIIRKNRHGITGTASTFFDMPWGKIRELEVIRHDLEY